VNVNSHQPAMTALSRRICRTPITLPLEAGYNCILWDESQIPEGTGALSGNL
jgi:hypothetical protein